MEKSTNLIKKYLNKIPKIIFTSNSNFYDDIFKIWLAEKRKMEQNLF